jgi:hypothetical protein
VNWSALRVAIKTPDEGHDHHLMTSSGNYLWDDWALNDAVELAESGHHQ